MFHKAKRTCMLEHRQVERLVLEPITCNNGNNKEFFKVLFWCTVIKQWYPMYILKKSAECCQSPPSLKFSTFSKLDQIVFLQVSSCKIVCLELAISVILGWYYPFCGNHDVCWKMVFKNVSCPGIQIQEDEEKTNTTYQSKRCRRFHWKKKYISFDVRPRPVHGHISFFVLKIKKIAAHAPIQTIVLITTRRMWAELSPCLHLGIQLQPPPAIRRLNGRIGGKGRVRDWGIENRTLLTYIRF